MREWAELRLGDISRIEIGGTPSRNEPRFWSSSQSGYPWLSIADLGEKYVSHSAERITGAGVKGSNVKLVPAGTPLMSFKLTIGRCGIAGVDLYTNEAIAAFYVDATKVDAEWLYYELPRAASRGRTDTAIKGITLNKAKLVELVTHLPPLLEQRQIAAILDTLDETIRKTEQIIAKLKQVKQGLLHDLLARGIDDNGELRDPELHPEQFKDSPLGRIPKGWDVSALGVALVGIDAGWSPACVEVPPPLGEWGVLKVSAVTGGEFDSHESKTLPSHLRPMPELEVHEGDILLARANGVASLVGVTVEARHVQPRLMLSDKLLRLVPRSDVLLGSFLGCSMRGEVIRRQIDQIMSGSSGQKNISQAQIRRMLIALPPTEEQARGIDTLRASELRANDEARSLAKLRLLRTGLMEDLLTGRVRVTPLLEQPPT